MQKDKLELQGVFEKGYGIIPKVVMCDASLSYGAKAIYAYFCSYAGTGGTCFPTRSKMCYDLQMSKDTLGKYISQLVTRGYIKVEQVKENGRFSHNIYTLNMTISPCPKNSDTENSGHENVDTNNNSSKNNSSFKSNSISSVSYEEKSGTEEEIKNDTPKKEHTTELLNKKKRNLQFAIDYITQHAEDDNIAEKIFAIFRARERKNRDTTIDFAKMIIKRLEEWSNGDYNTKIDILDKSIAYDSITIYQPDSRYNRNNNLSDTIPDKEDICSSANPASYSNESSYDITKELAWAYKRMEEIKNSD